MRRVSINNDIRQRQRALKVGALVLPPPSLEDLGADEEEVEVEIENLCDRRSMIWVGLRDSSSAQGHASLRFELAKVEEALAVAFDRKRRLRTARSMLEES